MKNNFRLSSDTGWTVPTAVVAGIGSLDRAAETLATQARSVLVVSDGSAAAADTVGRWLSQFSSARVCFVLHRSQAGCARLSEAVTASADYLVAVGGPHVIDMVKVGGVIARSRTRGGNADVPRAVESTTWPVRRALPVVAVPTTIGTATEVSPTAVLAERKGRHLIRHSSQQPSHAVLDPLVTALLSREQSLSGAVEALAQVLVQSLTQPSDSPLADELVIAVARCILDHADRIADDRIPPIVRTLDTHRLAVANMAAMLNPGLANWRADRGHQLWHLALPVADALDLPVPNVISMRLERVSQFFLLRVWRSAVVSGTPPR